MATLKYLIKGRIVHKEVNIENIIGVENDGIVFVIQTFKELYYFRITDKLIEQQQLQ